MPEKAERIHDKSAFPDPIHDALKNREIHATLVGSVRQVAVVAVDVAERTRRNHEEPHREAFGVLWSQFWNCSENVIVVRLSLRNDLGSGSKGGCHGLGKTRGKFEI